MASVVHGLMALTNKHNRFAIVSLFWSIVVLSMWCVCHWCNILWSTGCGIQSSSCWWRGGCGHIGTGFGSIVRKDAAWICAFRTMYCDLGESHARIKTSIVCHDLHHVRVAIIRAIVQHSICQRSGLHQWRAFSDWNRIHVLGCLRKGGFWFLAVKLWSYHERRKRGVLLWRFGLIFQCCFLFCFL